MVVVIIVKTGVYVSMALIISITMDDRPLVCVCTESIDRIDLID